MESPGVGRLPLAVDPPRPTLLPTGRFWAVSPQSARSAELRGKAGTLKPQFYESLGYGFLVLITGLEK